MVYVDVDNKRVMCSKIELIGEELNYAYFASTDFVSAKFNSAKLFGVSFDDADLKHANFTDAQYLAPRSLAGARNLNQIAISQKDKHNRRICRDALEIQRLRRSVARLEKECQQLQKCLKANESEIKIVCK